MSKRDTKSDLSRLDAMRDKEIDYSDIAEVDDEMFAQGELVLPETKETITIRIDKDVLTWFRGHGKGYQTRINAVLRRYMTAQKNSPQ